MRRPRGPRRPGPPWIRSTSRPAMTACATPPTKNSARVPSRRATEQSRAAAAGLAQLASPQDRPDLLDHAVTRGVHLLVQEGREVGVADDPLDLVPDLEAGVRFLELD